MIGCFLDPGPCIAAAVSSAVWFVLGFFTIQVLVAMFVGSILGAKFGWAGPIGLALAIIARMGGWSETRRDADPVETDMDTSDRVSPFRPRKTAKRSPPKRDSGPPPSLT